MKILRYASGALASFALILMVAFPVAATTPYESGQHKVWVCKYVGKPGDFETLKPGKQPISVDVAAADAYVGADFADGQTHSVVIDLQTDANTGQGETYTGDATCPTPDEPSTSPSDSESPSVSPSDSESPSVSPSDSESPSVSPSDSESPSASPSETPSVTPSSPAASGTPTVTPPPTDTFTRPTPTNTGAVAGLLFILAGSVFFVSFMVPVRTRR